jgi:hypothetical protein
VVVEVSHFPTPFPKDSETNPKQAELHHLKRFLYKIIVSYPYLNLQGPKVTSRLPFCGSSCLVPHNSVDRIRFIQAPLVRPLSASPSHQHRDCTVAEGAATLVPIASVVTSEKKYNSGPHLSELEFEKGYRKAETSNLPGLHAAAAKKPHFQQHTLSQPR